jgi:hypothetical protein
MKAVLLFYLLLLQTNHPVVFFSHDAESFSATGKWVDDPATSEESIPQEAQLDCTRQTRSCVQAIAEIYYGHPHVLLFYYNITRWNKDGITLFQDGQCMTNTIIITFADKSAIEVNAPKTLPKKQADACNFFGAHQSSRSIFVPKGSARWEKEQ